MQAYGTHSAHKGIVLSDLHLFTKRAKTITPDYIAGLCGKADYCILNGDIFDFKWSIYPTFDETAAQAASFLRSLCRLVPECHIYYVLGNHDCSPDFMTILEAINCDNFTWNATHVHIDRHLFIHGDLPMTGDDVFNRTIKNAHLIHGQAKSAHMIYQLAVSLRLHRIASMTMIPRLCSSLVYNAIEQSNPSLLHEIDHVYFGHTHHAFENYRYKGIYFHNTGSAVMHTDFNPIEVTHEAY